MKLTKQEQRLLDYLECHPSINPLQAWLKLGIYRLSAVVHKLKKKRHAIRTDRVVVQNRFFEDCNVASYVLDTTSHEMLDLPKIGRTRIQQCSLEFFKGDVDEDGDDYPEREDI